jgi:hypothetical protein
MADVVRGIEIIHPGAPHLGLAEHESAGLYDVDRHTHTGAQPQ